jgi:aryl-alcohol dehydrogenase-like predicted oxidoreductase
MQMRTLGRSGLHVSELALGAMTFGMPGWGCDEATSAALVNRFLDAGGNLIDTANVYLDSEVILGNALVGRRDEAVIATKVGLPKGTSPNARGSGRGNIRRACEASLRRLQTDRIDLYWVHVDDESTPLEETMSVLDDLVREGKVLYVGASNFRAYRLMKALAISDRTGGARFVGFQGQYSLIVRSLEREHLQLFEEEGLGLVCWSPLGSGMLTGKVARGDAPAGDTRLDQGTRNPTEALMKNERGFEIADLVVEQAKALGCSPAQLALAWLRTRPVASTVLGVRRMEQLDDNLGSLDVVLPAEVVTLLDEATAPPPEYPWTFIDIMLTARRARPVPPA